MYDVNRSNLSIQNNAISSLFSLNSDLIDFEEFSMGLSSELETQDKDTMYSAKNKGKIGVNMALESGQKRWSKEGRLTTQFKAFKHHLDGSTIS